uniref:Putative secreted protein n=1 Tax=Anopheles triannulatus TaxID=58253 RepID=A0A2M4B3N3_9DIPT
MVAFCGAYLLGTLLSMKLASRTSRSLRPPQSCVASVTCTLLYTLNHSGWWFICSAFSATALMNDQAWLKSANRYSL